MAFSLSVKPTKRRSLLLSQRQEEEMLAAKVKRVGIKDKVNVRTCVLTISW